MTEDKIGHKVMIQLKTYTEKKLNVNRLLITIDDSKEFLTYMVHVSRIVEEKRNHTHAYKSLMYLRRFMESQEADYAENSFRRRTETLKRRT